MSYVFPMRQEKRAVGESVASVTRFHGSRDAFSTPCPHVCISDCGRVGWPVAELL